jgi:hypothetical protein
MFDPSMRWLLPRRQCPQGIGGKGHCRQCRRASAEKVLSLPQGIGGKGTVANFGKIFPKLN